MIDGNVAYNALRSHDPRFDGVFFVGVTSTGIYCRPICPAKTPKLENCRFFESREAAEKSSFRPCLRCRPELAPGNAPADSTRRIAYLIARQLEEKLIRDGANLEDIAQQFSIGSRQLRRILQKEFGVSPIELIQTRRLLLAKQLLTETRLPIIKVAFASGFSSLRRFNDAFIRHYKMPPTRLRKEVAKHEKDIDRMDAITLQLSYRPPYDWPSLLEFLSARMIKGVEHVTNESYLRTIRLGKHSGWIKVMNAPQKNALMVELSYSLTPVLPTLLGRLRNMFDLNTRADLIIAQLMKDERLKNSLSKNPGLRLPGAFDGFEMAIRAILGQQITVKAATTIACRFAVAFGEELTTPFPELSLLSPQPERVASATVDDIAGLGIVSARAKSIIALAQAFVSETISLDVGMSPEITIKKLTELPGIGQWTAHYIAMRALHWPDAFPKEDIALRNNLGGVSPKQAEEMSQLWRPWRSYAVLHIWKNLKEERTLDFSSASE
ncbi:MULTISPECIES: AlkA N-terminal domain-containing protein [Legionella]|uniref:DNA-3-methyladenine glycosylase II n=1 Tax=Legionella drozanskii LLAP-1 TaxID=1212489 RepID=A0A0W0TAF3_9GAMM|nr:MULTISPECIES: AlkA N-terminal domain-containing protein [Legionella]KTC92584.1 Ada protein (O6-methylguanine-DNA methyltransferase) [Legionella drozanskii LLAP-1]PJE12284.1 MAG: DNA-3-methyladenine glycosylase 2 family protein [Legionella sp.]